MIKIKTKNLFLILILLLISFNTQAQVKVVKDIFNKCIKENKKHTTYTTLSKTRSKRGARKKVHNPNFDIENYLNRVSPQDNASQSCEPNIFGSTDSNETQHLIKDGEEIIEHFQNNSLKEFHTALSLQGIQDTIESYLTLKLKFTSNNLSISSIRKEILTKFCDGNVKIGRSRKSKTSNICSGSLKNRVKNLISKVEKKIVKPNPLSINQTTTMFNKAIELLNKQIKKIRDSNEYSKCPSRGSCGKVIKLNKAKQKKLKEKYKEIYLEVLRSPIGTLIQAQKIDLKNVSRKMDYYGDSLSWKVNEQWIGNAIVNASTQMIQNSQFILKGLLTQNQYNNIQEKVNTLLLNNPGALKKVLEHDESFANLTCESVIQIAKTADKDELINNIWTGATIIAGLAAIATGAGTALGVGLLASTSSVVKNQLEINDATKNLEYIRRSSISGSNDELIHNDILDKKNEIKSKKIERNLNIAVTVAEPLVFLKVAKVSKTAKTKTLTKSKSVSPRAPPLPKNSRSLASRLSFPRSPKEFTQSLDRFKRIKNTKNPFTKSEYNKLSKSLDSDMAKASQTDSFAKNSIDHMNEHDIIALKYQDYLKEIGIDPDYYRLLAQAHDMGKFVPDEDVLALASKWVKKHGGNEFMLGRISWHDQSTVAYLIKKGDELGIPSNKIDHLISDIMGHNDGSASGVKDIFWKKYAWPEKSMGKYPTPTSLEADILTFADRFGQGSRTGAVKIFKDVSKNLDLKQSATEAFINNPQNTIKQLESIGQRISDSRGIKNFQSQQIYKDAIETQEETIQAFNKIEWNSDGHAIIKSNDGKIYKAENNEEFLSSSFQDILFSN